MDREMERKTLYEAYTDYIDPATIITSHYLKKPFYPSQEQYFEFLNEWIEDEPSSNRPLVLKTNPGVGVKTILSHWHQQILQGNTTKVAHP